MTLSLFRLPAEFTICASALIGAGALLLQNADQYANQLENVLAEQPSLHLLGELPAYMRELGVQSHGAELNDAEKQLLAQLASAETRLPSIVMPWVEMCRNAQPFAVDFAPAEAPALTESIFEPEDTLPVSVVPEPALPEAVPADVAVQEAPSAPERITIPAAESVHWDLLSLPLAERRSIFPDLSACRHTGVYILKAQDATAEPEAPAITEPAPQAETVATPEPAPVPESAPSPQQTLASVLEYMPKPTPEPPTNEPPPAVAAASAPPPSYRQPAVYDPQSAEYEQTPPMSYRIMMVGDSLMEDLGPRLHRVMSKRKGVEFVISAKFSTGLCRPDLFNWAQHMRETVSKYPPDIVIFFMGANDGQPIKEGRYRVPTGGKEWRDAYGRKMDELVQIAYSAGADVIWVELPAVGGQYSKQLHENQIAQREYCTSRGVASLQTDPLFSGEWGRFEAYGMYKGRQVRLRTKDMEHLTNEGNMKLIDHLMPMLEAHMMAFYYNHPERHLTAQQAARIRSVPVIYTCKYTPPPKKPATPDDASSEPSRPEW